MLKLDIDPVLFSIGGVEIRYYGLVYVLGLGLVYFYLKRKAELSPKRLEKLMFFLVLGMVIGARVVGLVSNNVNILKEPLELFRVWHGGMSLFGGFFGMLVGGYWVMRKRILEVADYVVVPVSFVLILGRLANFVNQELVGTLTNKSWCFEFITREGCRHPYQLYSAFGHLILFGIIFIWSKKKYERGDLFFGFVLGYGVLRFITDFFKERVIIFSNLSIWQILAILFFIVGIFYFLEMRREKKR